MSSLFQSISSLQQAMTFHRERHTVLSGNVANVDTPGYLPVDLAQTSYPDAMIASIGTHEGHIATRNLEGVGSPFIEEAPIGPDGNAVQLERELAKIDANRVRYTTASELVSRRMALLRYAAGDGG